MFTLSGEGGGVAGAKSFGTAIFPICSPPPLINDQSLRWKNAAFSHLIKGLVINVTRVNFETGAVPWVWWYT